MELQTASYSLRRHCSNTPRPCDLPSLTVVMDEAVDQVPESVMMSSRHSKLSVIEMSANTLVSSIAVEENLDAIRTITVVHFGSDGEDLRSMTPAPQFVDAKQEHE
jgi:hypothetical protein